MSVVVWVGSMWFKKAASGASPAENFGGVTTGQVFRSTGMTSIRWEVGAVFRSWEPSPHVRLKRVGVPGDLKTVALETLCDLRFFHPEN